MLDHGSSTPVYAQLAALLRAQIKSGELAPGQAIPSEPEMVRQYGIARTTARRAIGALKDEQLVYTLPGEGTFVGSSPEAAPREPANLPPYRRVAADLVERIRAGRWQPERPLPSEQHLMQEYGVAKETVRRAVALLREQGWVYTVARRGSYVSPVDHWPAEG
ncbi:GntR family transcriptional regulator [Microtetraspora glauca]|uniref:GntR family transcriptional regulator n=1 Tax=Microtetraspora glauca TaxID=1996 RepID=A0ABV3GA80_MICGL